MRLHGVIVILLAAMLWSVSCERDLSVNPDHGVTLLHQGQLCYDFSGAILRPNGNLLMWGFNGTGVLGDGTLDSRDIPQKVDSIKNIVCIELYGGFALAIDISGNVWFWGRCLYYTSNERVTQPVKISKIPGAIQIQVMKEFLVLKDDGTVWMLDWNWKEPTAWIEPQQITGIVNVQQISSALALLYDGSIRLIDKIEYPLPGLGGPDEEMQLDDVVQVENVYNRRTVILKQDSTVWAWGFGLCGGNGDGTTDDRDQPVKVIGLEKIVAISANYTSTLALNKDGTVWYWGDSMPTGDEHIAISIPVKVPELENIIQIYAGSTCLAKDNTGNYWEFSYFYQSPEPKIILSE